MNVVNAHSPQDAPSRLQDHNIEHILIKPVYVCVVVLQSCGQVYGTPYKLHIGTK